MVGLEEGILPHKRSIADSDDSIDEERRLCYVGVTRAEEELTLSMANTRFKWGKPRPTYPSRFLYELTGQADHPNKLKAIRARPRRDPWCQSKQNCLQRQSTEFSNQRPQKKVASCRAKPNRLSRNFLRKRIELNIVRRDKIERTSTRKNSSPRQN